MGTCDGNSGLEVAINTEEYGDSRTAPLFWGDGVRLGAGASFCCGMGLALCDGEKQPVSAVSTWRKGA